METAQNLGKNVEIEKARQLLSKNIDDFKSLVLYSMRLDGNNRPSNGPLRSEVNRITDLHQQATESLEEWVNRVFAHEPVKKESISFTNEMPGETLEEWVARQSVNPKKTKSSVTIIDIIEQWLMNEAKKDLFAQMDASFGSPEGLSSEQIRELGTNLMSLADKLDAMKSSASRI